MTLKNAKPEIMDRVTKIEYHWHRTQAQFEFVQRMWRELHEDHQTNQIEILKHLQGKVLQVERRIRGLLRKRDKAQQIVNENLRIRRFKYLFIKPYLDAVVTDLATWQTTYDPSWFLIMKIASPIVDEELQRVTAAASSPEATDIMRSASRVRRAVRAVEDSNTHIFLPSEGLHAAQKEPIPYSPATVLTRPESASLYIIDAIPCPAYSFVGITTQDIRRLASKLRAIDPAVFGVLRCRGVVKTYANNGGRITSFEMIFDAPSSGQPHTLRNCLLSKSHQSLTDRINLAKRLATSISFVHTLDFVHKNVCPENIVGFADSNQHGLGSFYLIGFEQVRSDDGRTYMRGSDAWEKNIYRHPDRQGAFPPEKYNMGHDIYSLGVCLLEIGLWSSFVSYENGATVSGHGDALRLDPGNWRHCRPGMIKDHLISLAESLLPSLVGNIYAEVVVNCLTCLDEKDGELELLDDLDEDGDGVLVGVRFINKVSPIFSRSLGRLP